MSGWLFKKKFITMYGNMNVKYNNFFTYITQWSTFHGKNTQ